MKNFIAWLKAIFTRTKETNVSEITLAETAGAADASPAAAPAVATGAVVSGAAADAATPATATAVTAAALSLAAAPVTAATVAVPVTETTDDATALAVALGERGEAVLSALKDVLTFAKVEVDHIWDEAVAIALKLA